MSQLRIDGDRLDDWITGHGGQDQFNDTPPRFEDAVPPDPSEDAGGDVDEVLLDAVRRFLELAGNKGLDVYRQYSDLMAAADAKERARNEGAKRSVTA